jgi:hypothetical protein
MDFAKERLYFRGHLLSNSNPNEQTSPERLKVVGGYSNVTTYQLWPDFRVLKLKWQHRMRNLPVGSNTIMAFQFSPIFSIGILVSEGLKTLTASNFSGSLNDVRYIP